MRSSSIFQLVILGILAASFVAAALIFSGLIPGLKGTGPEAGGTVVMWGTLPAQQLTPLVEEFNRTNRPIFLIYIEKNARTFDRELVETLASGGGPDLILMSDELIYRHADKVYPISYEAFSQRDYLNTFVQESELYLISIGTLAMPLTLDPMVMYWNRDLFSSAGVPEPPKTWEQILSLGPKLTKKDSGGNLLQSGIAFGEFDNVEHAKDIVALLAMQAGNKIVERKEGGFQSVLALQTGFALRSTDEAVRYYTNFSNPVQPVYSWDKSQPSSRDTFLSGRLALYFGYASELVNMRNQNPHLNFDVAPVPQTNGSAAAITIGRMNGVAILKASRNPTLAFNTIKLLSAPDFSLNLAKALLLPPPRRDLLRAKPNDAFMSVFFDSALISRGWVDPMPEETNRIFKELVENVVSGRLRIGEAVMGADAELAKLFSS